jgi:hypothetical protein
MQFLAAAGLPAKFPCSVDVNKAVCDQMDVRPVVLMQFCVTRARNTPIRSSPRSRADSDGWTPPA